MSLSRAPLVGLINSKRLGRFHMGNKDPYYIEPVLVFVELVKTV